MELESIRAIQNCMEDLGLHSSKSPSFVTQAKIRNLLDERKRGEIEVIFQSNWHSGDGPYVELDDTIKGYGITYTCFKPKWQAFSYNSNEKLLSVKGNGYSFTLEF